MAERVDDETMIYTDENPAYHSLPNHETVKHSAQKFVRGDAHTNGIESHWAMLKRGIMGTYHHVSDKHLHRYTTEFEGRHNNRPSDTIEQIHTLVRGMEGKQLRYRNLIAA